MTVDTSTPFVGLKLVPELFDHATLGMARSLGRLGVETWTFHDDPSAPAARSRYARKRIFWNRDERPEDDPLAMLEALAARIGRKAVLLATDDVSSVFLSENARLLAEWFVFPEQPEGVANTLYDKKQMYLLCKRLHVPTPETAFPESDSDVERFLSDAVFPVVVKGIDSWKLQARTGVRMVIVESADELRAAYGRLADPEDPNLMLQEYIPGGAESVWMFNGYFDALSRCLFAVTGRKLRQFPPYTGMTSLGICLRNDEVEASTVQLMHQVGYRGVLDIGWRYDARDGRYKLLDVNPRLGASFRLFVGSDGLDVVRAAYLDLTGQTVPSSRPREGRRWLVENLDLVSSRRYFRDGALTVGDWARAFRGVDEAAWFAADDPLPFAAMAGRFLLTKARGAAGPGRFGLFSEPT
ncbi:MAG: carboxylate--amine ligase [Actinobacteria bacterium]|nr:carboxylate--amine ligase [Actinomycetota bacterium]